MYSISIEHTEQFLFCRVSGDNTLENVVHYLNDIHHAMEKYRCGKILIEENLAGKSLNLFKMYQVIGMAKKTVLSLPHAIAYVDINPDHDHKSLKFAETVALNRIINIKLFKNLTDASEWLEEFSL